MTPEFKNMEDLLAQLLVPDTDGIERATNTLQRLFATGEAVPMLGNVLQTCPSSQIRQYAAVLLRKRLGKSKHWNSLELNTKETVKTGIIPVLVNEKEKSVKVSIVQFIAVICKHEFKKGSWPEFSNFIQNLITSQNLTDVELGMFTMSALSDIAPNVIQDNPSNIAVILNAVFHALDDLNTILGYYTAKTMTHVASYCETNAQLKEIFIRAVPKIITSFPALAAKNEERACELTDFFYEVLTGPKTLITPYFIPYVQFCLAMSSNKNLGDSIRDKMIALIGETVRAKKKPILKHGLVKPIVEVLFSIMCEPLDGLDDDDDENWFNDEDSEQPTHAATVMLGSMAICLPPTKLLDILTDHVLGNFNSENLYIRKACYLALASVTEGAAECIRTNFLKPFVQCVTSGITDPSAPVRNAALFALGQFAVHLQPEVSQYHMELMPILFKYLNHLRQRVTKGGPDPPGTHSMFYAIETYCENLGEKDLNPYLPLLFEYLLVILDKKHSLPAQEQTISAIGAISSAAKTGVLPFFPTIIEKLKVYLISTPTEEEVHIQALALETLGMLIRTLGAEHFAPMAQETMALGIELLKNVDDPGTRAAVYSLFGALSTAMKDEAAIFLPVVTERIYATLMSTEGIMPVENEKIEPFCMFDNMSESDNGDEEDIATDSERSAEEDELAVENDYMAEKYEACAALKDFAVHAELAFQPYLMRSFEELVKFYDNIHVAENKAGWFDALARICVNMSKVDTPEGKKVLQQSLKYFLMQCLHMTSEDEYSVVNSALEAISTMVGEIGPDSIISPDVPGMILNTIRQVLHKKLPCQGREDDNVEDVEGDAEQDEVLVESACEILPALSKALNAVDFATGLEQLLPTLIHKLMHSQCSESQKSFYVGTLAECVCPMGDIVLTRPDICNTFYKIFLHGARDKSADVRNNSIFGLGELAKYGKQNMFSRYMEMLQIFASTMVGETKPGVVDNICGALSKMIVCNSSILPMEEIFPVLLDKLPLKEDLVENTNVIKCFHHLYQMGHSVLKNDIIRVINNCCFILLEAKSEDAVMWEVVRLLKSCVKDFPTEMTNIIGTLPPDSAKTITAALESSLRCGPDQAMVLATGFCLNKLDKNTISDQARSSWTEAPHDGCGGPNHVIDDRQWSWCYLRKQFKIRNLESLYLQYQQRLHRGYFSVFLLLQMILSIIHASVLLSYEPEDPSNVILPDIVSYLLVALFLWPLVAIVFKQQLVKKYPVLPLLVSCLAVATLLCVDIALPIYHTYHAHSPIVLRPAYGTHALLACYIFLPLQNNIAPAVLGSVVTVSHLATLGFVTYRNDNATLRQLASDAIFLFCVNILGLYFRFVNEVVIRRTFLDRRACVESTLKLNYEKEQEEQLMLSILPRHIASRVREDIRKELARADHTQPLLSKKPFNELYVEMHKDVSILYADVVNYTGMTGTLSVNTLVATLNELFGRFDEASDRHQVLRIKFLGDCYYCVAGVPTPNPAHARCCVELGLEMIAIIKEVREKRKLDIDMRIGVHSGNILSGLLGRSKWQYDVWSRDVIIANRMEQTGRPGMVHVTKQTMNRLGDAFITEPGYGHTRDQLLAKYKIETFLISPLQQTEYSPVSEMPESIFDRKVSAAGVFEVKQTEFIYKLKKLSNESNARRRTAFMDNNLYMYQQRLKMADVHMAKAIEKLPLGKYDQWFHKEQLHPICLTFRNEENWELAFLRQPDPLFKFYVLSALLVLLCMLLIQILGLPSWHWVAWLGFGISASLLTALLPLTWAHVVWHAVKDPHQELEDIPPPGNRFLRLLYHTSLRVVSDACIRTVLYCIVCLLLSVCAMADMIDCASEQIYGNDELRLGLGLEMDCMGPWQMTETCSLALLMSFLFLRIHFQLKLLVGLIILAVYSWCIWCLRPSVFESGGTWNPELEPRIAHVLNMLFLVLGLHLMDRQAEYMNRLDYRWKRQLSAEKDEASMTRMVNQMLLQNILPKHVAEVYLNTHRAANELYHENYNSVAVIFATLTNYTFSEDEDPTPYELRNLEMLNRIICDFDNKLFCKPYRRVEKIKVAGWTYMAACGLDPGRRESNSSVAGDSKSEQTMSYVKLKGDTEANECSNQTSSDQFPLILLNFAAEMMRSVRAINKTTQQDLKLRVGIAHGPITAGVVGSQKPLYDIWGNAVNLASRMDSTGEANRIQVPEATASVLMQQGVPCVPRGPIHVKGKGVMSTFFVALSEDFNLTETSKPSQLR